MKALGRQFVIEMWGCNGNINASEVVRKAIEEAVKRANATLLDIRVHTFNPHGVSGVAVIAESHISVHTWPEHGYAAVDVFTCGERTNPEAALEVFRWVFRPKRIEVIEIKRGIKCE